jgi:hypothetical protein
VGDDGDGLLGCTTLGTGLEIPDDRFPRRAENAIVPAPE